MSSLSLRHIYKIYSGNVKAVSDFNLEIDDKEFIVFVGPSGCGKSTTLRMIAGLEEISAGELYIDDKLVNDVEPKDRDIAMVFQNYALYPHMTVYDNMAFGLKLRKMPIKEIDDRVQEAASILGISNLLARKPKALSGGQRQRVALGRAIVREPKVFLLDEPLSNLDAKLRVQMRTEITKLHQKLATTFVYVTHDQIEAMTMGTRIVVMKDGIMQQVDTPQFLYDEPENIFVATFLGSPQMNMFKATLHKESDGLHARFGENDILLPPDKAKRIIDDKYIGGKEVVMGIRPEDIHDEQIFIESSPNTVITAHVDVLEKLGNETFIYMYTGGKEEYAVARVDARTSVKANEDVKFGVDAHHVHFFDPDTELTIMGVPAYNTFEANVVEENGKMYAKFGNTVLDIPQDLIDRFIDMTIVNGRKIKVGIAPDDLKTEKAEGMCEIKAVADFTAHYPRFTAVYSNVIGKDNYNIAKHPKTDELSSGDEITYYVDPKKIMIFDIETDEKLVAFSPITSNRATAKVSKNNKGDAIIQIGNNIKFVFHDDENRFEPGVYPVVIDFKAFSTSKEQMIKNPTMVFSLPIGDADNIGNHTVLYGNVLGFETYVTALIDGTPNVSINDRIKVCVDPEGIKRAD
ncbi:MAG: sn-glycerol-3-phosphate ABC transporter ATP-binding protein UgpC [Clostridia bacterium]|nr:sn-glycerol-3-phosphate ABC transporter ATP-binding protein UgpC [Clostridia bacterium]